MTRPGLTVREADMLTALRDSIASHGWPPSTSELGAILGVSTTRAAQLLNELRGKGCVIWDARGNCTPSRARRIAGPSSGPARVHLASAVVAYQQGEPVGVAYRVEPRRVDPC